MRFSFMFMVPAVLSLNLIACASDDSSNEPSHDVVTNQLVKDGDHCSTNSDCASNLCTFEISTGLKTKGLPAPVPACEGKDCDPPAPTPDPQPAPAPTPKGKPDPVPAPTPAPAPAPEPPAPAPAPTPVQNPTGICASR